MLNQMIQLMQEMNEIILKDEEERSIALKGFEDSNTEDTHT